MDNTTSTTMAPAFVRVRRSRAPRGHVVVVGQWRRDGATVTPVPYAEAVRATGGSPIVLSTFNPPKKAPKDIEVVDSLDPNDASLLDGAVGLVIPGGGDVDPDWYGAVERHPKSRNISHRRDRFETTLLAAALARDMPVLAICHGMQVLNVHLGGTLVQHLADDPKRLDHDRNTPRTQFVHGVHTKDKSFLADLLGSSPTVNSHHHQGLAAVGEPLEEIAWAEDGVLEGVMSTDHHWVIGVQWHPESLVTVDEGQENLFRSFIQATEEFRDRVDDEARSA
ncbi:MAG: gamma-glutamyl-gamma-aminobutyrate hydrolase family protein [Actinobacteria bacterium]|nr:gamma-glutamyl-gamma-aminobutyrate hydrolase family protein [Actinomycetota bacterium]